MKLIRKHVLGLPFKSEHHVVLWSYVVKLYFKGGGQKVFFIHLDFIWQFGTVNAVHSAKFQILSFIGLA